MQFAFSQQSYRIHLEPHRQCQIQGMIVRSCPSRRATQQSCAHLQPAIRSLRLRQFHSSSSRRDEYGLPNHYETLELETNASPAEVKKYERPAKHTPHTLNLLTPHPDNSTNSPNRTTPTCTQTTQTPPSASSKSAKPTPPSARPRNAPATTATSYAHINHPPPPAVQQAATPPPQRPSAADQPAA